MKHTIKAQDGPREVGEQNKGKESSLGEAQPATSQQDTRTEKTVTSKKQAPVYS
jgi:hypothetical protein